jgi:hypothetical protein
MISFSAFHVGDYELLTYVVEILCKWEKISENKYSLFFDKRHKIWTWMTVKEQIEKGRKLITQSGHEMHT